MRKSSLVIGHMNTGANDPNHFGSQSSNILRSYTLGGSSKVLNPQPFSFPTNGQDIDRTDEKNSIHVSSDTYSLFSAISHQLNTESEPSTDLAQSIEDVLPALAKKGQGIFDTLHLQAAGNNLHESSSIDRMALTKLGTMSSVDNGTMIVSKDASALQLFAKKYQAFPQAVVQAIIDADGDKPGSAQVYTRVLSEIERICICVDNQLFLVSTNMRSVDPIPSQLLVHTCEYGTITGVHLCYPKRDVFTHKVHYILVITTATHVSMLAVTLKALHGSVHVELLPTDLAASLDEELTDMISCVDGRLYAGAKDGCIYEITYTTRDHYMCVYGSTLDTQYIPLSGSKKQAKAPARSAYVTSEEERAMPPTKKQRRGTTICGYSTTGSASNAGTMKVKNVSVVGFLDKISYTLWARGSAITQLTLDTTRSHELLYAFHADESLSMYKIVKKDGVYTVQMQGTLMKTEIFQAAENILKNCNASSSLVFKNARLVSFVSISNTYSNDSVGYLTTDQMHRIYVRLYTPPTSTSVSLVVCSIRLANIMYDEVLYPELTPKTCSMVSSVDNGVLLGATSMQLPNIAAPITDLTNDVTPITFSQAISMDKEKQDTNTTSSTTQEDNENVLVIFSSLPSDHEVDGVPAYSLPNSNNNIVTSNTASIVYLARRFHEAVEYIRFPGRIIALPSTPTRTAHPMSTIFRDLQPLCSAAVSIFAHQHAIVPTIFHIITSSGVVTLEKQRPIDIVVQALEAVVQNPTDPIFYSLIQAYGMAEVVAMLTLIASKNVLGVNCNKFINSDILAETAANVLLSSYFTTYTLGTVLNISSANSVANPGGLPFSTHANAYHGVGGSGSTSGATATHLGNGMHTYPSANMLHPGHGSGTIGGGAHTSDMHHSLQGTSTSSSHPPVTGVVVGLPNRENVCVGIELALSRLLLPFWTLSPLVRLQVSADKMVPRFRYTANQLSVLVSSLTSFATLIDTHLKQLMKEPSGIQSVLSSSLSSTFTLESLASLTEAELPSSLRASLDNVLNYCDCTGDKNKDSVKPPNIPVYGVSTNHTKRSGQGQDNKSDSSSTTSNTSHTSNTSTTSTSSGMSSGYSSSNSSTSTTAGSSGSGSGISTNTTVTDMHSLTSGGYFGANETITQNIRYSALHPSSLQVLQLLAIVEHRQVVRLLRIRSLVRACIHMLTCFMVLARLPTVMISNNTLIHSAVRSTGATNHATGTGSSISPVQSTLTRGFNALFQGFPSFVIEPLLTRPTGYLLMSSTGRGFLRVLTTCTSIIQLTYKPDLTLTQLTSNLAYKPNKLKCAKIASLYTLYGPKAVGVNDRLYNQLSNSMAITFEDHLFKEAGLFLPPADYLMLAFIRETSKFVYSYTSNTKQDATGNEQDVSVEVRLKMMRDLTQYFADKNIISVFNELCNMSTTTSAAASTHTTAISTSSTGMGIGAAMGGLSGTNAGSTSASAAALALLYRQVPGMSMHTIKQIVDICSLVAKLACYPDIDCHFVINFCISAGLYYLATLFCVYRCHIMWPYIAHDPNLRSITELLVNDDTNHLLSSKTVTDSGGNTQHTNAHFLGGITSAGTIGGSTASLIGSTHMTSTNTNSNNTSTNAKASNNIVITTNTNTLPLNITYPTVWSIHHYYDLNVAWQALSAYLIGTNVFSEYINYIHKNDLRNAAACVFLFWRATDTSAFNTLPGQGRLTNTLLSKTAEFMNMVHKVEPKPGMVFPALDRGREFFRDCLQTCIAYKCTGIVTSTVQLLNMTNTLDVLIEYKNAYVENILWCLDRSACYNYYLRHKNWLRAAHAVYTLAMHMIEKNQHNNNTNRTGKDANSTPIDGLITDKSDSTSTSSTTATSTSSTSSSDSFSDSLLDNNMQLYGVRPSSLTRVFGKTTPFLNQPTSTEDKPVLATVLDYLQEAMRFVQVAKTEISAPNAHDLERATNYNERSQTLNALNQAIKRRYAYVQYQSELIGRVDAYVKYLEAFIARHSTATSQVVDGLDSIGQYHAHAVELAELLRSQILLEYTDKVLALFSSACLYEEILRLYAVGLLSPPFQAIDQLWSFFIRREILFASISTSSWKSALATKLSSVIYTITHTKETGTHTSASGAGVGVGAGAGAAPHVNHVHAMNMRNLHQQQQLIPLQHIIHALVECCINWGGDTEDVNLLDENFLITAITGVNLASVMYPTKDSNSNKTNTCAVYPNLQATGITVQNALAVYASVVPQCTDQRALYIVGQVLTYFGDYLVLTKQVHNTNTQHVMEYKANVQTLVHALISFPIQSLTSSVYFDEHTIQKYYARFESLITQLGTD